MDSHKQLQQTVHAAEDDPWVCVRCHAAGLRQRTAVLAPHSDVAAKRAHRRWAIEQLAAHPAKRPAVLYLDDRLPVHDDSGTWSYWTDDVLTAPALRDRLAPHQLFSPNLKAEVVEDLRRRGVVHAEQCCACLFVQRHASLIRDMYGGIALAFLDVWGGYDRGARPLMELCLSLRLLEPRGSTVTFAASDRAQRALGHSTVAVRVAVERDAQRLFRTDGWMEYALDLPTDLPAAYHTMQVYGWHVNRVAAAAGRLVETAANAEENRAECYDVLRAKIRECEIKGVMGLYSIADELSGDLEIDWQSIRNFEQNKPDWQQNNWKRRVVKALSTPGRFTHGGDRRSKRRALDMQIHIVTVTTDSEK